MRARTAFGVVAISIAVGVVVWLFTSAGDQPAAHRRAPGLPPEATLQAQNLSLRSGADGALRIGFDAFDPNARVIATMQPDTATVVTCALPAFDAPIPDQRACKTLASGVREQIGAAGMKAIAIVLLTPADATANVVLSFDEASRHVRLGFPFVRGDSARPACADNACNPFLELQPTRNGAFEATASWTGGSATMTLLQGSVLGRSFTATGIPYREAARAQGPSPLRVAGTMTAPGEYALALRQDAGTGLQRVTIDARWP